MNRSRCEVNAPAIDTRPTREIEFAHRAVALRVMLPAAADELLDETAFANDERLPYWADLWPSARALARYLIDHPPKHAIASHNGSAGNELRIIELGCGAVALPSLALARLGFEVVATDYEDDALRSVRVNARAAGLLFERSQPVSRPFNALKTVGMTKPPQSAVESATVRPAGVRTMLLDWREPPADLGLFHVVLAADVMYEQRNAIALADFVPRILAPAGRMALADPGRRYLPEFEARMRQRGFSDRELALIEEPHGNPSNPPSRVRIIEFSLVV